MNKKPLLYASPFIVFIGIAFFLMMGLDRNPRELPSALVGKTMPVFSLPSLYNTQQMLTQQDLKRGEPALLNVWATWCPSCRVEHPTFNELAKAGVKIYGLNYKDEVDAARHYLKQLGDPYQLNIVDVEGRLGFDLGVYGAPETYILDGEGMIHYRHVGVIDDNVWETLIKPKMVELGFTDKANSSVETEEGGA